MDPALRDLADRIAILDLMHRYARSVDEQDWTLFSSCFTTDALLDYTAVGGIQGPLAVVRAWLAEVLPSFALVQHLVTNVEVEIDGDRARCRSYLLNPMGFENEEGEVVVFLEGGIYRDQLVRTDQGWRISERRIEPTFSTRHHPILARLFQPQEG